MNRDNLPDQMYQDKLESDCVNNVALFSYLESKGFDPSIICKKVGIPEDKITKPGYMIPMRVMLEIMDSVLDLLGEKDPRLFYYIGREAARLNKNTTVANILVKLGNPESAVKFLPRFNRKFNNVLELESYNVTKNSGILAVYYKKNQALDRLWKFYQEYWNEGIIAGIPTVWGLPYMQTELCISRFSLEDVFTSYGMAHTLIKKEGTYFVNEQEIAKDVKLQTRQVEVSDDILSFMSGIFVKKNNFKSILTNVNSIDLSETKWYTEAKNKATLMTSDFKLSRLNTLKKGQVFGAEYSVMRLQWESKKKLLTRIAEILYVKRKNDKVLIKKIEDELTENKEKTFYIKQLYDNLKIQTEKEKLLEKAMTGGFAHEIRNALTGSQLNLNAIMNYRRAGNRATEELQNTLNTIVKNINQLKEKYAIQPSELQQIAGSLKLSLGIIEDIDSSFESMHFDLTRALDITSQIREYSRVNEITPGCQVVNLRSIIDAIQKQNENLFQTSNIRFLIDLTNDDFNIIGDETHFHSILGNLINNAVDALREIIDQREKIIEVIFKKQDINTKTYICIYFSDNGIGMDDNLKSKIFEPFFTTKSNKGTGLGLGIVKKMIHIYNGEIVVRSRANIGTTFIVRFPEKNDS